MQGTAKAVGLQDLGRMDATNKFFLKEWVIIPAQDLKLKMSIQGFAWNHLQFNNFTITSRKCKLSSAVPTQINGPLLWKVSSASECLCGSSLGGCVHKGPAISENSTWQSDKFICCFPARMMVEGSPGTWQCSVVIQILCQSYSCWEQVQTCSKPVTPCSIFVSILWFSLCLSFFFSALFLNFLTHSKFVTEKIQGLWMVRILFSLLCISLLLFSFFIFFSLLTQVFLFVIRFPLFRARNVSVEERKRKGKEGTWI